MLKLLQELSSIDPRFANCTLELYCPETTGATSPPPEAKSRLDSDLTSAETTADMMKSSSSSFDDNSTTVEGKTNPSLF